MIVFDLKCAGGHVFEAWFASGAAYESQRAEGRVRCPSCDSAEVVKAAMAPNIAVGGDRASSPSHPAEAKEMLSRLAALQAKLLEGSTWVGGRFAERARAMHAGEEKEAPIHGRATFAEANALVEEGVPVTPLPLPVTPPESLN